MIPVDPAVHASDLVVDRGPVRAVDGIGFTVERGTITALLGPNGAGKTSTVEHLEGYLPRTSGTVSVLGVDPVDSRGVLATKVGLMLQSGGIPTAVRPSELLAQYASFFDDPEDPTTLLEQVGLTHRARTPYRRLSGGEQQRLSLALALIGRPELLFLDEPTAGVDLQGRDLIRSLVRSQREAGRTVVLTTHDLTEAEQLADQVLIVDRGRLVAAGSPTELVADASEEDLRFGAPAGLDIDDLSAAVNATAQEISPGQYVVRAAPTPGLIADVTAWLARNGATLSELRAGRQNLEDVFRRLTTEPGSDTPPKVTRDRVDRSKTGQPTGAPDVARRRFPRPRPSLRRPRHRPGDGPALKAYLGQLRLEIALASRQGEQLLVSLGIPLMVLVFFSHLDVLPTGTDEPIDYLAPAVLALAVMSTAMVSLGIGTGFERTYGVLKRLGASPLGRGRWIAAKVSLVLLTELVQWIVLVAAAWLIGWELPGAGWLAAIAGALLGTAAFGGLGLAMAGTLPGPVTLALANAVYFLLLLTGGWSSPSKSSPARSRPLRRCYRPHL
ncbi:MAG: ATP-binding cassette domain-containing protein [Microthrixaceae bacterium]|nr:ATP-binding cassette domain-containing protein [Microthrixaceae bacterium]